MCLVFICALIVRRMKRVRGLKSGRRESRANNERAETNKKRTCFVFALARSAVPQCGKTWRARNQARPGVAVELHDESISCWLYRSPPNTCPFSCIYLKKGTYRARLTCQAYQVRAPESMFDVRQACAKRVSGDRSSGSPCAAIQVIQVAGAPIGKTSVFNWKSHHQSCHRCTNDRAHITFSYALAG